MQTEAQKRAKKKYDEQNMTYQTIKINKDVLQEFKRLAQENGDRVNTLFKGFIEQYIRDHTIE